MLDMSNRVDASNIDIRDAFFDELYDIAAKDRNVVFLTADMGALSLEKFKKDFPEQYINVGISEQNLISVAAGLSLIGKKVFAYAIAPFISLRCYEQIKIDICGMKLPVTLIGSGPGLTYGSDGPTHHAIEDIAIMRALSGITIYNPCDSISATAMAHLTYQSHTPIYIRLDKGIMPAVHSKADFEKGFSLLRNGSDLLIMATGIMVHNGVKLADELIKYSINAGLADIYRIKPLNENLLLKIIKKYKKIITLEEHLYAGGIGSAFSEILTDNSVYISLKRFAISETLNDRYGDREWLHKHYGLDVHAICNKLVHDSIGGSL